jgi:hypothetical protein
MLTDLQQFQQRSSSKIQMLFYLRTETIKTVSFIRTMADNKFRSAHF